MKQNYFNSRILFLHQIQSIKNVFFVILLLVNFLMLNPLNAQSITVNTPGNGSWTVPCDVTSITVQAWGAGGAGGAADNNPNGGSGGGGGGYSTYTVAVTPGQVITYTVGNNGNGGNGNGGNGTATTILGLTANGGTGGGQNQGAVGIGGTATGGTTNVNGTNGLLGTTALGAAGGFSNGLAGGVSRNTYGNGINATNPGSGGGGGFRNCNGGCSGRDGGDGANGQIRITYTSVFQNYCTPSFTIGVRSISNVTFAGINNTTPNLVDAGPQYESFCNTGTVIQGSATNAISLKGNTNGNNTHYFRVYIDWDQNGTFGNNATEIYNIGTLTNSTGNGAAAPLIGNIAVPAGAALGLTKMRVMFKGAAYSGAPCEDGDRGQAEDYVINVTASIPTITSLDSTSGCPGNSIVINGTNFIGITAANVRIGGTAVTSITSFTSTQITAVIGTGTTGFVTVTTGSGTATSNPTTFTVNQPSVAPTSITGLTTICEGDSTTLVANGGFIGTGATTEWFTGSCGGTSAGAGNSITISPTINTTYFVRYSGTCNTTTCASALVTVNTLSTAPTSISGTTTICSGNSTTLTVNGGTIGTGVVAQWFTDSCGGTPAGTGNSITVSPTTTTTYFVRYSGTCNTTSCTSVTVTVNSLSVAPLNITGTTTICSGDNTTLTVNGGSLGTGATEQWYSGSCGGTFLGTGTSINVSPTVTTDYYLRYSGTCNTTTCATISVVVNTPHAIVIQPAATQTVCSDSSVSISVGTSGTASTYQWYNGATLLNNGSSISGATTSTLTINPVTNADASSNYYCVIGGPCALPINSDFSTLIVNEKVTITSQPVASQTFCTGNTATFSILATGTGLTYQWYNGATPLVDGGSISGATSTTLSISSLVVSDASNNYHCVVSGASPCTNVTSNNAALIVNTFAAITIQPAPTQTICADLFASFFITATGGNLNYQWYKGATMLTNGGPITGATTSTLTINPITLADAATDYHCVVSNSCTVGLSSNNAELIVNETPLIPDQTLSVCSEDAWTLNLVNGVPTSATVIPTNTTYTWPSPILTGGMTGGIAGNNETTISQTLDNPTNTSQTATYFITPTSGNTGTCIGPAFALVVTVRPKPSINNITAAFCSEEAFSFTPTNGGGNVVPVGTTYSWGAPIVTGGMTGGTVGTNETSFNQVLTNNTNSDQTASFTVTATSGLCPASTFSVNVTIHPKPTVSGSILTQAVCSGSTIGSILLSNPNAIAGTIDYSWTRDNTTNITGISSTGNTGTISGNLVNTTNLPQTTVFTLIATSDDNCISNSETVSVIVNPIPSVSAAPVSQTICSENAITPIIITNPNSVTGTTFSWSRTNTTNLTGIAASDSTTSISGILTNITNVVQTTTFTITASANGCDTIINTITIAVNPKPTVLALPLTQSICGSSPFATINISNPNNVAGTTYSWTRNNIVDVTGLSNFGSGATISGTLQNNTNSDQTVTFTITATSGTCPSNTTTVDVIVLPTPLITISPTTQTRCHLQAITTINIGNSNAVSGTTYSWTRNNTSNLTGIPASGSGNSIDGAFSNNTTSTQSTTFTITALAPNGCSSTATVSVTVYAPLVAPTINAPQTVCLLSNPSLLTITTPASGGSGVYTYQWQNSTNGTTFNNIGSATNTTYQPPFVNFATVNTYYRLITTNICGSVTSNVIFVEVVSDAGFTFNLTNTPLGTLCPGSTFTPRISAIHSFTSYVRYTWNSNSSYISPSTGGPVGTTAAFITSSANIGPLTTINNTNATITTTISITPNVYNSSNNAFICSASPSNLNVSIYPKPTATATVPSATICNATSAGIVLDGNITDASTTFGWTRSINANVTSSQGSGSSGAIAAIATFTIPDVLTNTSLTSQIVTYTITPSSNGCSGTPVTVTITVAPVVTPGTIASNQTICNGDDPAAFTQTTAATGLNLTYQWQSSTDNILFTDIVAATSNTYDAGVLGQTTWFRRVVTSTVNSINCSATFSAISVTVNSINPGSISGTQTICAGGDPSSFSSVAASGAGVISYQWQSNITGCGGSWLDIATATNPTYDIPAGLAITTYYRRVATSTLNSVACSDFSNCITVFVNVISPGTVGNDQTLCGNNPAAFTELTSATAAGTISYQWQSSTTGCGGPWTTIGGATSATYDPPAGVSVTTYYQRITTSILNSVTCTAQSNCITVTANAITPGTISGNRTICNGGDPAAFTVSVGATGTNLTYQWQISTTTSAGPWTDLSGEVNATYDAPGPMMQTTYYRRIAFATVNSTSCSATSNFVTVFVNSVTPSTVAGDQSVCGAFDDPAAFTVTTPATGNGTLSYQWQSNTTGCGGSWANIAGAIGATYDAPNLLLTTYYRVVITSTLNSVQCTASSNCLTITSYSKTWNGAVSTDWNNGLNWSPAGVPTIADCVVIPNVPNDPYILGSNYSAYAKSLSILAGAELELSSNNSITVSDAINVNATGSFDIRNNASLVQVNSLPNVGKVTIERITQPMYRFDYTYWGTPVTLASNFTLGMLSPLTLSDKYFSWIPTVGNSFGNWFYESAATIMNPIKGYIVRAPQTFSYTPGVKDPYTANFIGTPNNGDISCPIYFGGLPLANNNDKYNLLGNPYASAVDAELFLSDPANVPVIDGTIYFWTHNSPPSADNIDPFYGDFLINYAANDYASWNRLGGTGTTAAAGSGGAPPSGFIASGQGFFTKSTGTATSGDPVVFRNSMRVNFNNDQFFRNSIIDANTNRSDANTNEKHRIWLNLVSNGGSFNQILVGYATDATNEFDRDFDGVRLTDNNSITFHSKIADRNLVIQGRALPFSDQDQVPLGYKSTVNDTFSIRIDHFDGLFENQNVYVEDLLLNVIHDLKQSPYTFTSGIGSFDDRFVLRYTSDAFLNTPEFGNVAGVIASIRSENLEVKCDEIGRAHV